MLTEPGLKQFFALYSGVVGVFYPIEGYARPLTRSPRLVLHMLGRSDAFALGVDAVAQTLQDSPWWPV